MLLLYKNYTTGACALRILFDPTGVLRSPYISVACDLGSRPHHSKISKIHVSQWGNSQA